MTLESSEFDRIIEVAPPFMRLPVFKEGGSERVVQMVSAALATKAQKDPSAPRLELWASGDSADTPNGRIITINGVKVPLNPTVDIAPGIDKPFAGFQQGFFDMYKLKENLEADKGAIGHIHGEDIGFSVMGTADQDVRTRTLTTIHNLPKDWARDHHADMPIVAISHAQAERVHGFDFVRVVHNGIDASLFRPNFDLAPDAPFSFIGNFSPNKNPAEAIRIAVAAGAGINVAGYAAPDHASYMQEVETLARTNSGVNIVGRVSDLYDSELGQSSKNKLLGNSRALLFPIQWKEPFGLVIAEANACGTPVIAYNYPGSSVEELIKDGVNGFKVNTFQEAVEAAKKIETIDRRGVRQYFEQNFSGTVMADNYMKVLTQDLPQYRKDLGLSRPGQLSLAKATNAA